jgi:hypothetical protein
MEAPTTDATRPSLTQSGSSRGFSAEFSRDPERERLKAWRSLFFSAYAVIGGLVVGLLVFAVSGLTQHSTSE